MKSFFFFFCRRKNRARLLQSKLAFRSAGDEKKKTGTRLVRTDFHELKLDLDLKEI